MDGGSSRGGGCCEGILTKVGGAVGRGRCIGAVVANGVGMIMGGGSVHDRGSTVVSAREGAGLGGGEAS